MKKMFSTLSKIRITQNIWLIVLSIIVSFSAWLAIMEYKNPITASTIPNVKIKYLGLNQVDDKDLFIESGMVDAIYVKVNGNRRDIISLKAADIVATVDLSKLSQGENVLNIDIAPNNGNVNIVSSQLKTITLNVDDVVETLVPIEMVSDGQLDAPFYVEGTVSTPQSIKIRGPESDVERIGRVFAIYPLQASVFSL